MVNLGYKLPTGRTVINLAPADLRKDAGAFDLPIAVGMVAYAFNLLEAGNYGHGGAQGVPVAGAEVAIDPVKHGGRNFLQVAKVVFEVDLSL